jgi:hypothetical protein
VALAAAEREVAEVRQLREEEDAALLAALEAMAGLWQQLVDVREQQGGLRLTDVGFSILQLPQEDPTPLQAVSGWWYETTWCLQSLCQVQLQHKMPAGVAIAVLNKLLRLGSNHLRGNNIALSVLCTYQQPGDTALPCWVCLASCRMG